MVTSLLLCIFSIEIDSFIYSIDITPIKDEGYINIYGRDITIRKKAEDKLLLHSKIMTNMYEGVYLIRLSDGIITYTNPRFEEMFGYNPGEMIGRHVSIVNDPNFKDPEKTAEEIMKILEKTGEWHGEIQNVKKDGTRFWCYANVSTFIHPEYGKVLISVHTDITERKKAEEELRLHSEIMTNMYEGVYLIRLSDGIITYANPRFEEMFGYNPGEMISRHVSIVNDPSVKDPEKTAEEIMKILEKTGEWHGEIQNVKKDGTRFWCYANVSTFMHPEYGKVLVSVHTDITGLKKAEQELKELIEKYEEAYNRMLFYQDLIAHDINNILNVVLTSAELLTLFQSEYKAGEDITIEIVRIKEQIIRGANLVANVRKLSRLEDESYIFANKRLFNFLEDSIELTKKSFPTRKIDFQIDSIEKNLYVKANELLFDVFINILNNAVKYNDRQTADILIKIERKLKGQRKFVKLEFIDNGRGIPDARKLLIFHKGFIKEKYSKGMGLGLSLVKKIVESYGGIIKVKDRIDRDHTKGSRFIIHIPEGI